MFSAKSMDQSTVSNTTWFQVTKDISPIEVRQNQNKSTNGQILYEIDPFDGILSNVVLNKALNSYLPTAMVGKTEHKIVSDVLSLSVYPSVQNIKKVYKLYYTNCQYYTNLIS